MTKEQFIKQIELMQSFNDTIDQFVELGMNLVETPLFNIPAEMFDNFIDSICTEDGSELVFWWMYEEVDKVIYVDGKEIHLDTLDQLYNYLRENNLFL